MAWCPAICFLNTITHCLCGQLCWTIKNDFLKWLIFGLLLRQPIFGSYGEIFPFSSLCLVASEIRWTKFPIFLFYKIYSYLLSFLKLVFDNIAPNECGPTRLRHVLYLFLCSVGTSTLCFFRFVFFRTPFKIAWDYALLMWNCCPSQAWMMKSV